MDDDLRRALDDAERESGLKVEGWNNRYRAALERHGFRIVELPNDPAIGLLDMPLPMPGDHSAWRMRAVIVRADKPCG